MVTLYCQCGHAVSVAWYWNGQAYVPRYWRTDTDSAADTIAHCPQCGDDLRPEILSQEPPEGE